MVLLQKVMRNLEPPPVAPADDYVAAGERVAVVAEIAALKFKFDMHALPTLGSNLALGLAIGESGLNRFDDVAQFFGDDSKKKDDALLASVLKNVATLL
jgi:formate dehydrogenase assembly factor FdhD